MYSRQFKELTDGLAGWERQHQTERRADKTVQRILRQTTFCDGASISAVRGWIKDDKLAGFKKRPTLRRNSL